MMKRAFQVTARSSAGFTLIELAIVIAILGILASLGVVKYVALSEKAREAATKSNLMAIRSAIAIYYGDREGVWPDVLGTTANYAFSNYLEVIPPVVAKHSGVGSGTVESPSGNSIYHTTNENITATGTGWRYSRLTGHIFVNSSVTDSQGVPYSAYGY